MIWQGWKLVEGLGRSPWKVRKLAVSYIRRRLGPLILQAGDRYVRGADHMVAR